MAIIFDKSTKTFYLEGKNITYAFFANRRGYLEHLYFGEKISRDHLFYTRTSIRRNAFPAMVPGEDVTKGNVDPSVGPTSYNHIPAEITFFGNGDYREPTVQVENAGGDRLCELLYYSHEILDTKPKINGMPSMDGGETLVVHLYDSISGFGADLYYTVYDDCDVIARRAVYKNGGAECVRLNRAYSFALSLPTQSYTAITLEGAWADERTPEYTPLRHGIISVDSKYASSSSINNPFMALLAKGGGENFGEAIGINLVYSSSFVLKAEGHSDGTTTILGGINDFDFSWKLDAGEEFETPEVIISYSNEGLGGMSRANHDALRNHLINKRYAKKSRPIVINNWEGTYFNFNNEKLMDIASAVAGTGIDTFVLDDGWFGKRDDDLSGLGDWVVNTKKLDGGLKTVIDHVHSLGMKFGLWFEPEMINEDSDIFRAHPDYAVGVPGRERCYTRHQFLMDVTRADVRDYIVEAVNKVIRDNEIDYIKWDFNRNATEFFSLSLDADRQKEFSHRYALGLYDLCERIVEANPGIMFEGCSGGGARFDPAILYYFPQIWTSDNTDAENRTLIQYGTSLAYPLSAMSCHVSEVPNHQTSRIASMKTRADIAHLGATGYELDTSVFTDEDKAAVKAQVKEYKAMEDLVLEGDLYRVENPHTGNHFAFMLVSKDKSHGMLTVYRRIFKANEAVYRIKAMGLDKKKKYYVPELGIILGGDTLMSVGLAPDFGPGDFSTVVYHFEEK